MPKKIYSVQLSTAEHEHLENILSSGMAKARTLTRARILLKAHAGWSDKQICAALDVSRPSVERTRQRYVTDGFDLALNGKRSTRQYKRKLDGRAEAHLIALVCGEPPTGFAQWSMRLLATELVKLEQVTVESISHETVRQVLKKTN